jgi:ABC-type transport system involved in cytochrome c biogenesis permease subunit
MRKAQQLREEAKDILANEARREKRVVADATAEALKVKNAELLNEIELRKCMDSERNISDKRYAAKIAEVILFTMIGLIIIAFFANLIAGVMHVAVIK